MVYVNNLPSILWELLFENNQKGEARKWRVLGQEQDGSMLFTWIHICAENPVPASRIGIYSHQNNTLKTVYCFDNIVNTIQASVNADQTLLAFVTKDVEINENVENDPENTKIDMYKAYIVEINTKEKRQIHYLNIARSKQIMVQFLYRKQRKIADRNSREKLVFFIHQEVVLLYNFELTRNLEEDSDWILDKDIISSECLARAFIWAQWDPIHQSLFYIHFRKPVKSLVEGEESDKNTEDIRSSPTLSGLQFHDDLPHETVLNIPLNLPQLPHAGVKPCGIYADDVIPLRIHDCSLDLYIASDPRGIVCICHHYLYEPLESITVGQKEPTFSGNNQIGTVHLAYSITLLHHGCVLHCVVPRIKWTDAKAIRPTFSLYGDHHMIVFVPGLFTHLLDIGTSHEPMCHIVTSPCIVPCIGGGGGGTGLDTQYHIVPLINYGKNVGINLINLDLVELNVTTSQLIDTFRSDSSADNKIAILHYLLVHQSEFDSVGELITILADKPIPLTMTKVLKEFLIAGAYATSLRNLPQDALQLVHLLPISTMTSSKDVEVKINKNIQVKLTHEVLWNTAMMLLSPQQRIVPYRGDMWTRLWEQLSNISKGRQRFKTSQVSDKLIISLVCYQPEALSRCSTPLSPGGASLVGSTSFGEIASSLGQSRKYADSLPFYEIETCTASKQEHVISVNLRELSMHLLKQTAGTTATGSTTISFGMKGMWQTQQTPMHVHAVATRYVAAQLEMSKLLCHLLCRSVGIQSRNDSEKGFLLIDQLDDQTKYILFTLLERYYLCVESLAFPLPQGFNSFFAFLGYRVLSFSMFMQYVKRNVFELQVDVMKIIMADISDTKEGMARKLKLLSLLPRSRAKRLLSQWSHPIALMIRAREHALNVLSGVEGQQPRPHSLQRTKTNQLGLAAFPSADRLSPLDTFLDLLTAKASLTDLDFGLLIEATIASTEEFL